MFCTEGRERLAGKQSKAEWLKRSNSRSISLANGLATRAFWRLKTLIIIG